MLVQPSRQGVEIEVGDERMDGCCWIECRIFLVLAVHFFAYLAADAREWRQKHAAFEESDYWGI